MSTDPPAGELHGLVRAVRVEVVFHATDEERAHIVAAKMVDRAHEIANLPECECDVDVNVERVRPGVISNSVDLGDAAASKRPTKL